jgi:tetratricopeptide (TPR) repeat protein
MRYIILFCWICIFPFAGYSTEVVAEKVLQKADSLFQLADYQQAGIWYDKAAYLSVDNMQKTHALMRKGDCYLMRSNYAAAEQCLSRITYYGLNDSMQYAARYKTALSAYLNSSFENAESQILQLKAFVTDTVLSVNAYPLYALILNENNRWTEAKEVLLQYISSSGSSAVQKQQMKQEVEKLYAGSSIPRLKDVEKAKKLSSIIPGTGQIYAGYWGEGILSVTLQAVGLGITGLGIWKHYYASGVLIGFSFFQRFYMGGITRTEFLAQKKNYTLKRNFNNSRKEFVLKLIPN